MGLLLGGMGGIIADIVEDAATKAINAKISSGPAPAATPVAQTIANSVVAAVNDREDISAVPVKSMAKSTTGLAAILSAGGVLAAYFGPQLPVNVNEAINNLGSAVGLPPGTAQVALLVGSYAVIWVRRWLTKSVTPTAVAGSKTAGTSTL